VNPASYRFQLATFECLVLSDGSWDYPLKNLFANSPTHAVHDALRRHGLPLDYVTTPYTCIYINTGEHQLLVDMGAGDQLAPRTGHLVHSMELAGIEPAQIDTVVITHAHPDHVGGALDTAGQPQYTNAVHYILQEEWDFWFSEISMARAPARFVSVARQNLDSIRDQAILLEGESEIVPGIRAIPAHGHTPGHMVVEAASGQARLLCIGDTALHPLHLEHPDWLPIYDMVPESAATSKRRVFDLAAAEKALVMAQHFPPFPSLGTVLRNGPGWKWRPVDSSGTISSSRCSPSGPTQTRHPGL
jgi:glyoxylase-like metal-dependent hydrolase (beta-lactamase superfamily II)